ncbi:HIT domain-containing protein [Legionella fairfieldensis]|uniref:HIT domain-containing protein n=1 Tax=Legionella fairfieldensis TaxID=45064 RepID=UPI000491EE57|nr:HIT domain-containing protein [Legionella fairfieldensis]
MVFTVDKRISESCIYLGDWPLSRLYFKKEAHFPWVILVPREEDIKELYQLSPAKRRTMIEEIAKMSQIMEDYFKPDKLNIGALGNIVSQLHIHIVARFESDSAWPHSIWQPDLVAADYPEEILETLTSDLTRQIVRASAQFPMI